MYNILFLQKVQRNYITDRYKKPNSVLLQKLNIILGKHSTFSEGVVVICCQIPQQKPKGQGTKWLFIFPQLFSLPAMRFYLFFIAPGLHPILYPPFCLFLLRFQPKYTYYFLQNVTLNILYIFSVELQAFFYYDIICYKRRLRWYGHDIKMNENHLTKIMFKYNFSGYKSKGRLKRRQIDCVKMT